MFNNVGILALSTLAKYPAVKRVAIVDIDVHSGNGAEKAFLGRSDILDISLHQDRCFPTWTGHASTRGEGEGFGYTLNVPLPPGSGNDAYAYAFDKVVEPALRRYKPDIILVASGADANVMDPLARQMVDVQGFRDVASRLKRMAEELCGGKIVFVQEG